MIVFVRICSRLLDLVGLKWYEKILGTLKKISFAFRLTDVVIRPLANGYNHPYIYIHI